MKEETDSRLVAACKDGDTQAFELLVKRYQRKVYAVALGMLHNSEDAKDATQDAFVKAYRYIGNFRGTSSFYTWLYRIAVNLCIDRLRKSSRYIHVEYDDRLKRPDNVDHKGSGLKPSTLGTNPSKSMMRRELKERIQLGLESLTDKHRAVIVMRELQGLSYAEMAKVMKCSKGTIMSRLFHARKKLQEFLADSLEADEG